MRPTSARTLSAARCEARAAPPPRTRRRSRSRSRALVIAAILQIPAFVRLLYGLMRDRNVALLDKVLVGAALAYVALPVDLVADFIPFLGLVDDVFLVAITVRRLIAKAGMRRAMLYWRGKPRDLRRLPIEGIIAAAARFLPVRVRRRLSKRLTKSREPA